MSNTAAIILAIVFIVLFIAGIVLVMSFIHKWGIPLSGNISKEDIKKIERRVAKDEKNMQKCTSKLPPRNK